MTARLAVWRTPKLYIGGQFVRSESGQTVAVATAEGILHACRGSRKDLRDATEHARAAQPKWAARAALNRGQILYRLGEMLEGRGAGEAADRAVHHAGWADKVTALLSTLNPVSATYVNYTMIRPVGVIAAVVDPATGMLGMVEALAAATVMGNSVLLLVAAESVDDATTLAECIATSDWPAGVVQIVTGTLSELVGHVNGLDDIDTLLRVGTPLDAEVALAAEQAGARTIRRLVDLPNPSIPATPEQLGRLAEAKTVWMSAYEPQGGAASY